MPQGGSNFVDVLGKRFGRLTVIARTANIGSRAYWICLCDCGTQIETSGSNLRNGNVRSCKCLQRDRNRETKTTHGKSKCRNGNPSPEYKTWQRMKNDCYNPRARKYPIYGGRGITVCDRWLHSFENFLADMGTRPADKTSVDRINNNGNYEPGNCRWATAIEQARNRRNNRHK